MSKKAGEIFHKHRVEVVYAGVLIGALCVFTDTGFAQNASSNTNGFMKAIGAPITQLAFFATKGVGGLMAAVGVGKAAYEKFTSQSQQGLGTSIGLVGGGAALANADSLVKVTGLSVSLDASGLVFF
ncbi:hypothetical protein [Anaerovibrio sp.]|uniref:hypothetical protein n=1 Tax=Anaerovibrio sp. TaxID=1872532 RepID=UPI00262E2007|nr:hypothetical protein [Anaerovibrio sp.]MDD6598134.1 hypothetical protein [Anaerovibrio sp.]